MDLSWLHIAFTLHGRTHVVNKLLNKPNLQTYDHLFCNKMNSRINKMHWEAVVSSVLSLIKCMLKKLGYMHKLFLTLKLKNVRLKVCVNRVVYILMKNIVYPIYCYMKCSLCMFPYLRSTMAMLWTIHINLAYLKKNTYKLCIFVLLVLIHIIRSIRLVHINDHS